MYLILSIFNVNMYRKFQHILKQYLAPMAKENIALFKSKLTPKVDMNKYHNITCIICV